MSAGKRCSCPASQVGYVLLTLAVSVISCTPTAYLNGTTDLGGTTPGARGSISLQFINNTPYRALFTYGTYDPQNDQFTAQVKQFATDSNPDNRLEGNTTSPVITFAGSANGATGVGREVSLGGFRLLQLIHDEKLGANLNENVLVPGIGFSSAPLDSPDADQPTAGKTDPNEALLGVDYQHDSLIVYTFSVDADQPSGFRVDRVVILP